VNLRVEALESTYNGLFSFLIPMGKPKYIQNLGSLCKRGKICNPKKALISPSNFVKYSLDRKCFKQKILASINYMFFHVPAIKMGKM
jgi:hypothetical protein